MRGPQDRAVGRGGLAAVAFAGFGGLVFSGRSFFAAVAFVVAVRFAIRCPVGIVAPRGALRSHSLGEGCGHGIADAFEIESRPKPLEKGQHFAELVCMDPIRLIPVLQVKRLDENALPLGKAVESILG